MSAQVSFAVPLSRALPPLRCLWIAREMPFPQDAGDRIYSAQLARALAAANVHVRYLAHAPLTPSTEPWPTDVEWKSVQGPRRNAVSALLSSRPHVAAMHDTAEFREALLQQLREHWDAIVLDGYASGWALPVIAAGMERRVSRPAMVYVSHNHEASLWQAMRTATSPWSLRRCMVWQNALKVRMLENRLVAQADVLTTITSDDALAYSVQAARRRRPLKTLVLTPGYSGQMKPARHITAATPRHVVVLGSFRWSIKQENLRRLLAVADAALARHGIVLDIIGDVPDELRAELSATARATRFHGFVNDPAPLLEQARIALVPEVVGGGFKLKLLDYMFARVPVFALSAALAGLPDTLRAFTVSSGDLEALVSAVIRHIDDVVLLDDLQNQAGAAAEALFRWEDRGVALAQVIAQLRLPSRSAA